MLARELTHSWLGCALFGLCAGLLLAGIHGLWWMWLAGAGLAGLGLLWPDRERRILTLVLLGALWAGYGRGVWRPQPDDPLRQFDGLQLVGAGVVLESPRGSATQLRVVLRLDRIEGRPEVEAARVLLVVRGRRGELPQPVAGQVWKVSGRLAAPRTAVYPGGYDARERLAARGIYHELRVNTDRDLCDCLRPPACDSLWGLACRVRLSIMDSFLPLSRRQRALMCGVVLGETQFLDAELAADFRRTGTTHLLAASGLNVGLVVGLWLGLGARLLGFGRRRLALSAIPVAWFYALLAGSSASVNRAAAMASLALLAYSTGRRVSLVRSLGLAALACLWLWPDYLLDAGFQMSTLAVACLGLVLPGLARLPGLGRWPTLLLSTVAVTLGLLPLLAWHFQQVAPGAVLANLVLGPPAELLLPLGLATWVLASIHSTLAWPLLQVCRLVAGFVIKAAGVLGAWLPAGMVARPPGWVLWLSALGLLLFAWGRARTGLLSLLTAAALLWIWPGPQVTGLRLRVVFPGRHPVLWFSRGRDNLVLVAQERDQQWALSMLRRLGVAGARVACLPAAGQSPLPLRWQGLRGQLYPDQAELSFGRLELLWRLRAGPRLRAPLVIAPGKATPGVVWVGAGPGRTAQEIRTDGLRIWLSRWGSSRL